MRKRVLIVDDHQPFRATARRLLADIPKPTLSAATVTALVG